MGDKLITDKHTDYVMDPLMNAKKIKEALMHEIDDLSKKRFENPPLENSLPSDGQQSMRLTESERNHRHDHDRHRKLEKRPDKPNDKYTRHGRLSENKKQSERKTTEKKRQEGGRKSENRNKTEREDEEERDIYSGSERSGDSERSNTSERSNASTSSRERLYKNRREGSSKPLLDDKLINDAKKFMESPEKRKRRATSAYNNLQEKVKKGLTLSKCFTMDSDPDEMEAELLNIQTHESKVKNLKFYERIFFALCFGLEFANNKFDPIGIDIDGWGKSIYANQDEFSELIEELYDKYKGKGAEQPIEVRFLVAIIFSIITFHFSKQLLGNNGISSMLAQTQARSANVKGPMAPPQAPQLTIGAPPVIGGSHEEIMAIFNQHDKNKQTIVQPQIPQMPTQIPVPAYTPMSTQMPVQAPRVPQYHNPHNYVQQQPSRMPVQEPMQSNRPNVFGQTSNRHIEEHNLVSQNTVNKAFERPFDRPFERPLDRPYERSTQNNRNDQEALWNNIHTNRPTQSIFNQSIGAMKTETPEERLNGTISGAPKKISEILVKKSERKSEKKSEKKPERPIININMSEIDDF